MLTRDGLSLGLTFREVALGRFNCILDVIRDKLHGYRLQHREISCLQNVENQAKKVQFAVSPRTAKQRCFKRNLIFASLS